MDKLQQAIVNNLLKHLSELADNTVTPYNVHAGICVELANWGNAVAASECWDRQSLSTVRMHVGRLMLSWPLHSGTPAYPVPAYERCTKSSSNATMYKKAQDSAALMWTGSSYYPTARRALCQFLAYALHDTEQYPIAWSKTS